MSELELRDAILRHALQLQRLSAGQEGEAESILRELERELTLLLNSQTISEADKRAIQRIVAEAESAITARYSAVAAVTDTHALAVVVADHTVQALEDVFPTTIATPTAARLASLTKDVLIDGAQSSAWWSKQAEDTAFKFAAQVQQGVLNGETNERIVQRVVGKQGEPGIMNVARRNARALVHSSIMNAANQARLATFRKNAGLLDGVRWLSTLDSHVCPQCAALDGQTWDLEGQPLGDTTVEFMVPPAHFSCRCLASPLPKSLADLGIQLPEGSRASSQGPVPASTTFSDFLKRQSPEFVDKVLGKARAEMFLAGRLTLKDLISGTGRELTLDQLGI